MAALDEYSAVLAGEVMAGDVTVPELRVCAGRALVMVTSHDCGLDKEFSAAVTVLMEGWLDEAAAMKAAEARDDLDRSFSVSPLVDPASVTVAGEHRHGACALSGPCADDHVTASCPSPTSTLPPSVRR